MRTSRGIGDNRRDDALDGRLASEQGFWHRRDRRVRMLDGKVVVRKAPLAMLGRTLPGLVFFLLRVANVVVVVMVVMIGVVVFVRRPIVFAVMARVAVMRSRPMLMCAERFMKRHVDCGQNLDAAEPNEACEHGCPTDGRSGPTQASRTHALGARRWKTSQRTPRVRAHLVSINRLRRVRGDRSSVKRAVGCGSRRWRRFRRCSVPSRFRRLALGFLPLRRSIEGPFRQSGTPPSRRPDVLEL